MQFKANLRVLGMKASQGEVEGTKYDHTTVYTTTALAESDNAKGEAGVDYRFGKSAEYQKYAHLPMPFDAVGTFEIVTSGKVQKTVLIALLPSAAAPQAAKAA